MPLGCPAAGLSVFPAGTLSASCLALKASQCLLKTLLLGSAEEPLGLLPSADDPAL